MVQEQHAVEVFRDDQRRSRQMTFEARAQMSVARMLADEMQDLVTSGGLLATRCLERVEKLASRLKIVGGQQPRIAGTQKGIGHSWA